MARSATVVWEVRPAGSGAADTNGGGYKSDAGTTDYSIAADGPELTDTDGACAGNTTVTSANGGFTAQMVGNIIYLSTGPVWHEITAYTDTNTITIDANGPTDTGMTFSVGGALASPGLASGLVLEGNWVHVKAGTYNLANTTAGTSGGPVKFTGAAGLRCGMEGYQTTRGDLGTKPMVKCNGQTPTYIFELDGATAEPQVLINMKADGDSGTRSATGFKGDSRSQSLCVACEAIECSDGFNLVTALFCKAYHADDDGFTACSISNSWADKCDDKGFQTGAGPWSNCLATNNGGDGFVLPAYTSVINCTAYNNGADGFTFGADYMHTAINCVSVNNTAYGYSVGDNSILVNCADYGNGTARSEGTELADIGAITLTSDPFDNAADPGGTYEPNDIAGGGADLQLAGMYILGQIDSVNIGAIRQLVSAGGIVGAANKFGGRQA